MRLRSHDGPFPQRAVRRCPSVLRRATATVRHLFAPGASARPSSPRRCSIRCDGCARPPDTIFPILHAIFCILAYLICIIRSLERTGTRPAAMVDTGDAVPKVRCGIGACHNDAGNGTILPQRTRHGRVNTELARRRRERRERIANRLEGTFARLRAPREGNSVRIRLDSSQWPRLPAGWLHAAQAPALRGGRPGMAHCNPLLTRRRRTE